MQAFNPRPKWRVISTTDISSQNKEQSSTLLNAAQLSSQQHHRDIQYELV